MKKNRQEQHVKVKVKSTQKEKGKVSDRERTAEEKSTNVSFLESPPSCIVFSL